MDLVLISEQLLIIRKLSWWLYSSPENEHASKLLGLFSLSRMFGLFWELSCQIPFICNYKALWFHLGAKGQQMTAGNTESPFIYLKANSWSQWYHCQNPQWISLFEALTLRVSPRTDYGLDTNYWEQLGIYLFPFCLKQYVLDYLSQRTDSQITDSLFLSSLLK